MHYRIGVTFVFNGDMYFTLYCNNMTIYYPPILQFSRPCNKFTSVWSMFLCNTSKKGTKGVIWVPCNYSQYVRHSIVYNVWSVYGFPVIKVLHQTNHLLFICPWSSILFQPKFAVSLPNTNLYQYNCTFLTFNIPVHSNSNIHYTSTFKF